MKILESVHRKAQKSSKHENIHSTVWPRKRDGKEAKKKRRNNEALNYNGSLKNFVH